MLYIKWDNGYSDKGFQMIASQNKAVIPEPSHHVRLDTETGFVELLELCKDLGIAIEARATKAQSEAIERAGKSILFRGRIIRLHSGLPSVIRNREKRQIWLL